MINKFFQTIKYYIRPPKKGDIYYGDPLLFIMGKPVEYVLHGLTDKSGRMIFNIVPSEECYRYTIENSCVPNYFVLKAEVFCTTKDSFIWRERVQAKRMDKNRFKQLVINGLLTKGKNL